MNNLEDNYRGQMDNINFNQNNMGNNISNGLMNMNNNFYRNSPTNNDLNMLGNITNDNLMNMANSIDPSSLNGTNLDDFDNENKVYNQRIKNDDNTSLIKSLTKEIISNLKENKNLYDDDLTINSKTNDNDNDNDNDDNSSYNSSSSKSSSKKSKKSKLKDTLEEFIVSTNPVPSTNGYIQWLFEDLFDYKDFLVLFILYFVLSQEMIKDFFSKYFTSLNPDSEGKVNVQGIIVYGLILTILFMIIRKIF